MVVESQVKLSAADRRRPGRSGGSPRGFVDKSKCFRIHSDRSVNVLELELPDQIDTAEFDQINDSLLSMLHEKSGENWVLDLSRVNYMGSAMLGLIVNVRQQIKNIRGDLVLCGL